jgi:hypothetical protein
MYQAILKNLQGVNTSANFAAVSVIKEKCFITLTPGVNVIKLFSFITVHEAK